MQIVESGTKIEQRFYEERQKQKRDRSTHRKIYDHNLLNRNKKFFDQQSRSSPKFSSKMSINESFGKSQFVDQESQTNKRISTNNNSENKIQKKQSSKYLDISMGYEFSPYNRTPSRTFHNQSLNNKQNIMQTQNIGAMKTQKLLEKIMISKSIESDKQKVMRLEIQNKELKQCQQKYKQQIKVLKEQLKIEQYKQKLRVKSEQLQKLKLSLVQADKKIQILENQLNINNSQLQQLRRNQKKNRGLQKIINSISVEVFNQFEQCEFEQGLQQYLKKNKKNNEFIMSIIEVKQKVTGSKQQNLKQVWRWFKKLIHEVFCIRDFLESLKYNLNLSSEASFQQLKERIIKKVSK